jgi:hypothetical protein
MDTVCQATTKWPQVTDAINEVVQQTETTIRWGLKVFPDTGACTVGDMPAVGIGDKAAMAIATAITGQTPKGGGTPTRAGITTATAYLANLPETNPKYILLATDGLPNCGSVNNNNLADDTATIAAVMDSAGKGIPVFVVGIATSGGTVNSEATLNMMAMAGGRPQVGAQAYYPVASKQMLVDTLKMIQRKIASCEFKLAKKPPYPDMVAVTGNGTNIPKSATAGWDYGSPDQTSIVLTGTYCDQLTAGTITDVQTVFMCEPVFVP